jgi:hypothetical protein
VEGLRLLIGFQISKSFSVHEQKFRQMADNAISSVHHNREMAAVIIAFMNWIGRFGALNSIRTSNQWFVEYGEEIKEYKVLPPSAFQKNDNLPNRYVLLRQIGEDKGVVTDFGDFHTKKELKSC